MQQTITLLELVKLFGSIIALLLAIFSIIRIIQLRNKDYATKEYIEQKSKVMETRVSAIEQNIINNEAQNRREHDRLTKLFDKIDKKLDQLIDKFV